MKIFKEPLLHFLLLGAVIFGVYSWRKSGEENEMPAGGRRIEVNAATITRLKEGWMRQFQRTPTAEDMRGLVQAHIREEVLCREALALGLDRDDTIVRRRLAQKMEFLTQDIVSAGTPDEKTLQKYFLEHQARYAQPARASFRHVYFSREKRGARTDADAKEALAALAKPGASDEDFGDGFLGGFEFSGQDEQAIVATFGAEFAAAVMKVRADTWTGTIASSYGTHLVLVTEREKAQPAEFAAVREAVMRDFLDERRRAGNEAVLARMKANYEVVIDQTALKAAAANHAETAQTNP